MGVVPRLADVNCHRLVFQPGDRLLVETTHRLNHEECNRLRRTIQKWAGCEVEVLIYCIQDMKITTDKKGELLV